MHHKITIVLIILFLSLSNLASAASKRPADSTGLNPLSSVSGFCKEASTIYQNLSDRLADDIAMIELVPNDKLTGKKQYWIKSYLSYFNIAMDALKTATPLLCHGKEIEVSTTGGVGSHRTDFCTAYADSIGVKEGIVDQINDIASSIKTKKDNLLYNENCDGYETARDLFENIMNAERAELYIVAKGCEFKDVYWYWPSSLYEACLSNDVDTQKAETDYQQIDEVNSINAKTNLLKANTAAINADAEEDDAKKDDAKKDNYKSNQDQSGNIW